MLSKIISKVQIIFIIFTAFIIIGCSIDPGIDGVLPKEEFTLLEFYSDNMVFQQNSEFKIIGKSEEGVVLKASLYNENDELIVKSESMADVNGDFTIVMKGQKGSFKHYYLEITDGLNVKKIQHISFGDVWIFAGEQEYQTTEIEYDEEYDFSNISFIRSIAGKIVWSKYEESDHIYSLVKTIAVSLKEKINVPVAFVDASLVSGYADSWMSYETATKHKNINKYLSDIERYDEEQTTLKNANKLSSMYETYFNGLKGIEIKGIIWSQGVTEFKNYDKFNKNVFISNYVYLLIQMFNDMMNSFNNNIDIYCIQESYLDEEYAAELREIQAISTYQIKDVHLIPTYDSFVKVENDSNEDEGTTDTVLEEDTEEIEEIYEFSIYNYIERITDIIFNCSYTKKITNVSTSYTDFIVDNYQIMISFDESYELQEVEELFGLQIINNDGVEISFEFTIQENDLYINLLLDESTKTDDFSYTIYYGYVKDIYKCNLRTTSGMPIVPFRININK